MACPAPALCIPSIVGTGCDPVCQTGTQTGSCKWCTEKCGIAGDDGTAVCVDRVSSGARDKWQSCTPANLAGHKQTDNCVPGTICLGDFGSENTRCFPLCGSAADCQNVACTPRQVAPPLTPDAPVYTAKVCDPPYTSCATSCCNPILGSGCLTGQTCYLVLNDSKTNDNRTVCEDAVGIGGRTSTCTYSRECSPGWFCTDSGSCRQVCDPKVPNPCLNGALCNPYGNQFGYCS